MPAKKWAVLVYSAADNNLKADLVDDADEIERVGSDATTDLVVQLDEGGTTGAWRRHLQADSSQGLKSPVLARLGSVDMAAPETLADMIEWGVKTFPAEHYMVVIADHGDGWKGVAEDDSHQGWMSLDEIQAGLRMARERTGVRPDILGFDACNMAGLEVGYQLRDEAGIMIASEKTESSEGWPYTPWLRPQALQAMKSMMKVEGTPQDVARAVVRAAAGAQGQIETLSAMDLTKIGLVADSVKGLSQAVTATETPSETLKKMASATQTFEGHKDLYDFCERLVQSPSVTDPTLKKAATEVMESMPKVILAEQHAPVHRGAHGLTMEIPTYRPTGAAYNKLELSQFSNWPAAQQKICGPRA